MNKQEFLQTLKKKNLLSVYKDRSLKQYVDGSVVFVDGAWKNTPNVFGIYEKDGKFIFFMTDAERGIPEYTKVFELEEDAFKALLEKVSRLKRIYENRLAPGAAIVNLNPVACSFDPLPVKIKITKSRSMACRNVVISIDRNNKWIKRHRQSISSKIWHEMRRLLDDESLHTQPSEYKAAQKAVKKVCRKIVAMMGRSPFTK